MIGTSSGATRLLVGRFALVAIACGSLAACGSDSQVFIDARPVDARGDGAVGDDAAVDATEVDAAIDAAVDAPVDAPAIDAPPIDAPPIDAPPIDAMPIDAMPIDAPPIDAPIDAPVDGAGTRPPPITTSLMPGQLDCGSGPITLTVNGQGFAADSIVRLAGHDLATTFVSPIRLTAIVPPGDLTMAGSVPVTVFTPPPGGGTSAALPFTVQAASRILSVTPIDFLTQAEGGLFANYQIDDLALDWDQDYGYFVTSNSDATLAGIRRFRISTMAEDVQARFSDILNPAFAMTGFVDPLHSDGAGTLYATMGSSNSRPIVRIDATTMHEVGRFGTTGNGLNNTTTSLVATTWLASGGDFLATASLFNEIAVLTHDLAYVWGAAQEVDEPRNAGVVAGTSDASGTDFWFLGSSSAVRHTALALYRVHLAPGAHYDPVLGSIGVTRTKVATFTPDQIQAGVVEFYGQAGGLTFDETDGGVIFQAQVANGTAAGPIHTVKWRNGSIVWNVVTQFALNYEGPFQSQNRTRGGLWTQMRGFRMLQLDTTNGSTFGDDQLQVTEGGAQAYDGGANVHLVRTNAGWTKIAFRRCHL